MGTKYAKKALMARSRDAVKLVFSAARDRRTWTPEPPPPPRRNLSDDGGIRLGSKQCGQYG